MRNILIKSNIINNLKIDIFISSTFVNKLDTFYWLIFTVTFLFNNTI